MLDNKGKLFGKVSVIDLLVVCIVIIMAIGAYMSWQKINNKTVLTENKGLIQNSAADTLEVTMRLEEVRQITMDAIHIGDDVFMKDTGKFFGQVVDVYSEPAKRLIYSQDGTPIEAVVPNRLDVLMVVHVPGKRLENGYYTANNIHLVYDSSMEIKTPSIQTIPKIETIKTVTGV
ncbi:MAG: DUF4330 domain-containing protein [Ruminococcaceae bacterium]|nr:DUF4330 domain-containing protein [Oscillospiraceae bacterium]